MDRKTEIVNKSSLPPRFAISIYVCVLFNVLVLKLNSVWANNLELTPSFRFEHFNKENGFLNAQVKVTLQDRFGYLWIGSAKGLSRFDGYEFVHYAHDADDVSSLSGNIIEDIYEDSSGRLWIASWDGLDQYHRESDSFSRYNHDSNDSSTIASPTVRAIVEDDQGMLWLGRSRGLSHLDPATGEIRNITLMEGETTDLTPYNNILDLAIDDKGKLWISTWAAGLGIYDPQLGTSTWYQHDPENPDSISSDYVWHVFFDDNRSIWVSTFGGLNRFDISSQSFEVYRHSEAPDSLSSDEVFQVESGPEGKLWVATHNGLNLFDPNKGSFQRSLYSENFRQSLSDNVVQSLRSDDDGNLWIGTFGGALNKLNWQYQQFVTYRNIPSNSNSLSGDSIASAMLDSQGNFWLGYRSKGLDFWDSKTGTKTNLSRQKGKPDSLPFNDVTALYEDSQGNIWVGTDGAGLLNLNVRDRRFSPVNSAQSTVAEEYEMTTAILEHPKGTLWVGTWGAGLKRLQIGEQGYSRVYDPQHGNANGLNHRVITAIEEYQDDLFVGTMGGGLYRYVSATDSFVEFRTNNSELPGNYIASLLYSEGALWIGTQGAGLARLDLNTLSFHSISNSDGLTGNSVSALIDDSHGYIWAATDNGLTRIAPDSLALSPYSSTVGALDYSDVFDAAIRDSRGNLYFGSRHGLTRITPGNLQSDQKPAKPLLTKILLNNQPFNDWQANKKMAAPYLFEHSQNNLEFWFSAMHLARPSQHGYQYQLEGLDTQWRQSDAHIRRANYTNLNPGNYRFVLKAANHDGIWSEPLVLFRFRIRSPWWDTSWAYVIYLLLAISAIFTVLQFRTRQLRKHANELKTQVAQKTAALHAQKSKVEELLSEKSAEFAVLSHELRTPLTLIIGPLQTLLQNHNNDESTSLLTMAQRNASRLLRLVEHLLQLERIQHNDLHGKQAISVHTVVSQTIEAFQPVAREKGIALKADKIEALYAELVPDTLEKVLSNLISNGLKYGKKDGWVKVTCKAKNMEQCYIIVEDNGIGIPDAEQNQIFLRYRRGQGRSDTEQQQGNGIGLSLVKDIVEQEGGEIRLESRASAPDSGSKFVITLPLSSAPTENETGPVSSTTELEVRLLEPSSQGADSLLSSTQAIQSDSRQILLVEDNADMLSYLKQSLSSDYHCLQAQNGQLGFDMAKHHIPDLIISDVMMPEKDGFQLSKLIKETEITCHIPVILLTAKSDVQSRLKGWQHYADEYLGKPFIADELLLRVENLLTIRDILRNKFVLQTPSKTAAIASDLEKEPLTATMTASAGEDAATGVSRQNKVFVAKLEKVVALRYPDPNLKVGDLAQALSVSDRQLVRKLKAVADVTPKEFLRGYRLQKAKQQLAEKEPVGNVAYNVGFSSHAYFSACFKAEFGVEPSVYASRGE